VTHINFGQQVDKKAIFLLFGCYCINPRFVLDEKFVTNANDYPENFHKMIWGALVNIVKKGILKKFLPLSLPGCVQYYVSWFRSVLYNIYDMVPSIQIEQTHSHSYS